MRSRHRVEAACTADRRLKHPSKWSSTLALLAARSDIYAFGVVLPEGDGQSVADELWERLLDLKTLKLGWHLARRDSKQDFLELPYYVDAYGVRLEWKLREIQRLLASEKYAPSPLTLVEVPKGTLAIRPGSVPALADRIVLQSIVALIAPVIDPLLSDAVYSYRVRDKRPDARHGLFRESDVIDLAFLKSRTISRDLDPFESWYNAWPDFDEATRRAFEEEGYLYLAVSDIVAYFENIQLPILRDLLLGKLNGESKIVNLLFVFLETWSTRTVDGRSHWRGVPQGTQIGSFLRNLFLIPLDDCLTTFCTKHDAKYFRYMDDVKIFAKEPSVARLAILTMDRILRRLHLNTQGAKTLILREHPERQITHALVDERLEELERSFDELKDVTKSNPAERRRLIAVLDRLSRHRPRSPHEQPIYGARQPLKDMSLRTFRRLITAYIAVGDHKFVKRLFDEIQRNPDYRLTRKLISASRRFPRKRQIASLVASFIQSPFNIFPHQEAELLRAVRYLARIPDSIRAHCERTLLDHTTDFYVRIQSAFLLSRIRLAPRFVRRCHEIFSSERSYLVQASLVGVLIQLPTVEASKMLETVQFHPNDVVRNTGIMLVSVRDDAHEARDKLKHIFREGTFSVICDYVPVLYAMALSREVGTLKELRAGLLARKGNMGVGDLWHVFEDLMARIGQKMAPELPMRQPPTAFRPRERHEITEAPSVPAVLQ